MEATGGVGEVLSGNTNAFFFFFPGGEGLCGIPAHLVYGDTLCVFHFLSCFGGEHLCGIAPAFVNLNL